MFQPIRKVMSSIALVMLVAACSSEPAVQRASSEEGDASTATTGSPSAGTSTSDPSGSVADQPVGTPAAAPPPGTVIQVQEVGEAPGLIAELTEATRKEGVLTVKVRFRNTRTENVYHGFETTHGDYSLFYVTAGDQKFFVLKDSEGAPLAPKYLDVNIGPSETATWWAKFPAPPASETTFDLVIPDMTPFEDVPIIDR